MEEARRVLERLQRIEALRTGAEAEAEPGRLLAELRALLSEGEAWLAAECAAASARPRGPADAVNALRSHRALAALGEALDRESKVASDSLGSDPPDADRQSAHHGKEVVAEEIPV